MFQNIVFAYDGSADCRDALEEGIALASRFDARCHLLAVVPPLSPYFLTGPMPEDLSEKDQANISAISREASHACARRDWTSTAPSGSGRRQPRPLAPSLAKSKPTSLLLGTTVARPTAVQPVCFHAARSGRRLGLTSACNVSNPTARLLWVSRCNMWHRLRCAMEHRLAQIAQQGDQFIAQGLQFGKASPVVIVPGFAMQP